MMMACIDYILEAAYNITQHILSSLMFVSFTQASLEFKGPSPPDYEVQIKLAPLTKTASEHKLKPLSCVGTTTSTIHWTKGVSHRLKKKLYP